MVGQIGFMVCIQQEIINMKATLEFDLDNEDDRTMYEIYSNARKMHYCLWQIEQELRSKTKYAELTDEQYKVWDEAREMFYEKVNANNIDLDL